MIFSNFPPFFSNLSLKFIGTIPSAKGRHLNCIVGSELSQACHGSQVNNRYQTQIFHWKRRHILAFFQKSPLFSLNYLHSSVDQRKDNHVGPQRNSCAEKVIFSLILAFLSLFRHFVEFLNPWFIPVIHWNILWKAVNGH